MTVSFQTPPKKQILPSLRDRKDQNVKKEPTGNVQREISDHPAQPSADKYADTYCSYWLEMSYYKPVFQRSTMRDRLRRGE